MIHHSSFILQDLGAIIYSPSYFNSDIGIHMNKQWAQQWKLKIPRLKKKWGKKKNVFAKFALVGKLIKSFFLKDLSNYLQWLLIYEVACLFHNGSLKAMFGQEWMRYSCLFI